MKPLLFRHVIARNPRRPPQGGVAGAVGGDNVLRVDLQAATEGTTQTRFSPFEQQRFLRLSESRFHQIGFPCGRSAEDLRAPRHAL